jgi:hypothetical protein
MCNGHAATEPNMAFSFKIQNEHLMDAVFDLSNTDTILIKKHAAEVYTKCCQANAIFIHHANITIQFTVRSNQVLIIFLKNASLNTMWHRPQNKHIITIQKFSWKNFFTWHIFNKIHRKPFLCSAASFAMINFCMQQMNIIANGVMIDTMLHQMPRFPNM